MESRREEILHPLLYIWPARVVMALQVVSLLLGTRIKQFLSNKCKCLLGSLLHNTTSLLAHGVAAFSHDKDDQLKATSKARLPACLNLCSTYTSLHISQSSHCSIIVAFFIGLTLKTFLLLPHFRFQNSIVNLCNSGR